MHFFLICYLLSITIITLPLALKNIANAVSYSYMLKPGALERQNTTESQ